IFDDPQYAARENIKRVADPRIGELAVPNVVPRLTGTPGAVDWLGQSLGQSNALIYGELLGLSEAEQRALSEEGVI
ncbi:MAG: CoA transferase, partial [Pseudomonadota bacterium]